MPLKFLDVPSMVWITAIMLFSAVTAGFFTAGLFAFGAMSLIVTVMFMIFLGTTVNEEVEERKRNRGSGKW